MTAIIAVATDEFVVLAGDKRATYLNRKGYRDDESKLYRINQEVVMGTSGHIHVTAECIEFLQSQHLEKATVQGVALKVRQFFRRKLKEEENISKIVILAGIGDGNKITVINMHHEDDFKFGYFIPTDDEYHTVISVPQYDFHDYLDKAIDEVDQEEDININNVSEVLTKTIKHVSEHDSSVSAESDIAFIKKNK